MVECNSCPPRASTAVVDGEQERFGKIARGVESGGKPQAASAVHRKTDHEGPNHYFKCPGQVFPGFERWTAPKISDVTIAAGQKRIPVESVNSRYPR